MKKLATLFLAFMISGFAFGQDRQQRGQQRTPEENAKFYTEKLTKELKLNAEQQEKIYDLTLERAIKAKDRGSMKRGDMSQDKMQEMRAERKAHQDKLESILTPEQLKTWNESRASVMKNRSDRTRNDRKRRDNKQRSEKVEKEKSSTQDITNQ